MFSVIMSGWGILVIVRFMERLFGHDNKRGPKSDIKKYAGYIFDACSLVILSVSIWFLSVAVLGKFSNSTLGNTINPSLDVATSISVFFAMLTFTISKYFKSKKARQQKEVERKKDSIIRTRKAVEDALMRIKTEIDKFQEKLVEYFVELSICEQKLEVLKSVKNLDVTINYSKVLDAENDFKSSFNSMTGLYVFYLSILPDKLQREFTIAINFMPKDMGDKVRKRLETEIIRLTNLISLSISNINKFSSGYGNIYYKKENINKNILKQALGQLIHLMITRNSKEDKETGLSPAFVSIDEFFFTMQNYLITMIELVEEDSSENIDLKKLKDSIGDNQEAKKDANEKLSGIHNKLEAKGKKDYDVELALAFCNLDPKKSDELKDELKNDALNNGANPNISYNDILIKYKYFEILLQIQDELSENNKKSYDIELLLGLLYNDQDMVKNAINHNARTDDARLIKFIMIKQELKAQGKTDYEVELFIAVIINSIEKVKDAIEHGADPNITDTQIFDKYRAILNAPEEVPSKQDNSPAQD